MTQVRGEIITNNWVGRPAFGELERNAVKVARSVLRRAWGS